MPKNKDQKGPARDYFFFFKYSKDYDIHYNNDPLCRDFWQKYEVPTTIDPNRTMIKEWVEMLNDEKMPVSGYHLAVPIGEMDIQTPFKLRSALTPLASFKISKLLTEFYGVCIVLTGMYIFAFCEDFFLW